MLPVFGYLGYIVLTLFLILIFLRYIDNNGIPRSLPLVGMLPVMLLNLHRPYEKVAEVMEKSKGTFFYQGIWFTNTSFLGTCDPENVRHILSTYSSIYIKGSEWMKTFDVFGETLFNSDGESWKKQRKIFHSFLNHPKFHKSVTKLIPDRIEQGLVQVFEHVSKQGMVVDLQELLTRHAYDIACLMVTGHNPRLMSIDFPESRFHTAMNNVWEAAFYRYILPDNLWMLLSWLQIWKERRRSQAWKSLDELLAEYISIQREKSNKTMEDDKDEEIFTFLKCYLEGNEVTGPTPKDSVIRDSLINMMFATDDTNSTVLSWFFYLILKNPMVVSKIREELKENLSFKPLGECEIPLCLNELNKLPYLHATLCETLRLYPPIPFEFRTASEKNILPTGHYVDRNVRVILAVHAMGRMTWLWGKDCEDFKPERWITKDGKVKRELPSKFIAFNAGARICAGKELAFIIMKATAATIIHNYNVFLVKGQKVAPKNSIIFRMKNGLMVRIKNRWN